MSLYFYLSLSTKGELIFQTASLYPSWPLLVVKLIALDTVLVTTTLDSNARPMLTVLFNLTHYLYAYILIIIF